MSEKESILLEIISFLSAYLADEIDKVPEEGGWVRTDNTAYKKPEISPVHNEGYWTEEKRREAAENAKKRWTPEARKKQSEVMKGNKKGYRNDDAPKDAHKLDIRHDITPARYNQRGTYHCTRCGRMNRNIRTCHARVSDLPIVGARNHRITRGVNQGKYTDARHVRWQDWNANFKH